MKLHLSNGRRTQCGKLQGHSKGPKSTFKPKEVTCIVCLKSWKKECERDLKEVNEALDRLTGGR